MRLSPTERERLAERARDPDGVLRREQEAEASRTEGRRLWAAVMLTADIDVCRAMLGGRPVLARRLDAEALRRALRGSSLPPPETYITVTPEMLDAVAEGGSFESKARAR